MKLAGRVLLLAFLVAGLSVMAALPPLLAQDVRFVRIGTGPIGGTYFPVGALIANVISGPPGSMPCDLGGSCGVPGLIATAVSTQGSVNNIQDMATGKLDLALCQANIASDAYNGAGLYSSKRVETLRTVANLFPEAVHIVVRRNTSIKNISALKDRRVSLGEENSGTLATARIILRGYGLPIKDLTPVYEKLARSAEMLSTGEIDAFFMVGGPPVAAISHVAERMPIALLPISGREVERIVEKQRFFSRTVIPDNVYPGVPATETIGVGAHLLVSAAMDEKLVYSITRALWDPRNRRVLDNGSPNGRRIQLGTALDGLAVPLHDGARRFYVESGITKAGQL